MEPSLVELKKVLRSLVVSSPTQMDARSLLRDYRAMLGVPLPYAKYGYRDPLTFLRERFADCFLFRGDNNPVLTLIVPEQLKHIDDHVQRQKIASTAKVKGKRRSVMERIPQKNNYETDTIAKSFQDRKSQGLYKVNSESQNRDVPLVRATKSEPRGPTAVVNGASSDRNGPTRSGPDRNGSMRTSMDRSTPERNRFVSTSPDRSTLVQNGSDRSGPDRSGSERTGPVRSGSDRTGPDRSGSDKTGPDRSCSDRTGPVRSGSDRTGPDRSGSDRTGPVRSGSDKTGPDRSCSDRTGPDRSGSDRTGPGVPILGGGSGAGGLSTLLRSSSHAYSTTEDDSVSTKTSDCGTKLSSGSGSRGSCSRELSRVSAEVAALVEDSPEGVWLTELMGRYRQRYGRELDIGRCGVRSVVALAGAVSAAGRVAASAPAGAESLLLHATARPPPAAALQPRRAQAASAGSAAATAPAAHHTDDALPGIDFDPEVFPADCVHYLDSIAGAPLQDWTAGAMLPCVVGEVYSPSHFWLLRLGDDHYSAMDRLMDEMTEYYERGAGRARWLSAGAARLGHYCAARYEGDWHRAVIVRLLDCDSVKVRHIDYGTVELCLVGRLKPLPRRWAALPAQAVRARLAAARPAAMGRRWPRAAAARFLHLVRDKRLVANVVARDLEEEAVEVVLVDTSTDEDVTIARELVRAGYADARDDSALHSGECYLLPRFAALENGATPNYAEIIAYLRGGVQLDFVDDYRRHVPAALPPAPAPTPAPAPDLLPAAAAPPPPPDLTRSHLPAPSRSPPVRRGRDRYEVAPRFANKLPATPETPPRPPTPESTPGASQNRPSTPPPTRPQPASGTTQPERPTPVVQNVESATPETASPQRATDAAPQQSPAAGPQPQLPTATGPHPPPPPQPHPPPPPLPHPPQPPHSPHPPPQPQLYRGGAGAVLSEAECEIFRLLSRVDERAAHWYMLDALRRAPGAPAPQPPHLSHGPQPSYPPHPPQPHPGPAMMPLLPPQLMYPLHPAHPLAFAAPFPRYPAPAFPRYPAPAPPAAATAPRALNPEAREFRVQPPPGF